MAARWWGLCVRVVLSLRIVRAPCAVRIAALRTTAWTDEGTCMDLTQALAFDFCAGNALCGWHHHLLLPWWHARRMRVLHVTRCRIAHIADVLWTRCMLGVVSLRVAWPRGFPTRQRKTL